MSSVTLAARLWFFSALVLGIGIFTYCNITNVINDIFLIFLASIVVTILGSIPAFLVLIFVLPIINKLASTYLTRITTMLFVFFSISCFYGGFAGLVLAEASSNNYIASLGLCISCVFAATIIAFFINLKHIKIYFLPSQNLIEMESHLTQQTVSSNQSNHSNKIWIKGLITGGLILVMLIPTLFVSNLVEERQQRQEEIKNEVSSKWAGEQTITFPYLFIPYSVTTTEANGKISVEKKSFIILPENLNVNGNVLTEQRQRSIYSVLLYNSSINAKGNFSIQIPDNIDASTIDWSASKLCVGISDFKGIEQKISARINNNSYDFSAGLPTDIIDSTGLSVPISLSNENVGKLLSFELPLKIKGSDQLHFTALAGNSQFDLKSNWSSPSFDGNTLPSERNLDNKGFEANWNFNKANLPFNTAFKDFKFKKDDYSFGVTLLQPTDQYAKTLRCIKYALLFIGLTFSFFFIIEIMQKKPFHPVQYVLVGIALIVFFSLLLSISEFLLFNIAYLIASVATVLLITLYAKSHFKSWKIASAFTIVIGSVYAFIFVLISLEDTALLVGSIGLFIIVALAMYASRKINWYGNSVNETIAI